MTYIDDIKHLIQTTTLTNRQIAEKLGCSRRTVRRVAGPQQERLRFQHSGTPKILLFDIETAPMEVYIWSLGKNVIGPDNIVKEWCVLSWAAKWLFDPHVMSMRVSAEQAYWRDDSTILKDIWSLLDEADIIIAHNAINFDIARLNARFIGAGFAPPRPYQVIDTYRAIKKITWFSSGKLDYLNKFLELKEKKGNSNYQMWVRAVTGDETALVEMLSYNEQDVFALEELYLKIRPWIRSHPNVGLYLESDEVVCPACGNKEVTWKGSYYTPAGKYESFRCENCGAIGRSRHNSYDKDKRSSLCLSVAR